MEGIFLVESRPTTRPACARSRVIRAPRMSRARPRRARRSPHAVRSTTTRRARTRPLARSGSSRPRSGGNDVVDDALELTPALLEQSPGFCGHLFAIRVTTRELEEDVGVAEVPIVDVFPRHPPRVFPFVVLLPQGVP